MNTQSIGTTLQAPYNKSLQQKPNALSIQNNNQYNEQTVDINDSFNAKPLKDAIYNIIKLNNNNGTLETAKNNINTLQNSSDSVYEEGFGEINQVLQNVTDIKYNDKQIFNTKLYIEKNNDIYLKLNIDKPHIENLNDVYIVQNQSHYILEKINEVQSKVNAKVDKEADSMDYTDFKEKKEFDQKRIDDYKYNTHIYETIVDSTATEKKLLWLLG
jgi:hypothetical protein